MYRRTICRGSPRHVGLRRGGVPVPPTQQHTSRMICSRLPRLKPFAFLLLPPLSNVFFAFFAWYLFWLMGSALENTWGTFRYNLYLWTGWVATIVAALATNQPATTNMYLQMSVFLAFAYLFPNFEILIFFILPVKVKWLALLTWLGYGYMCIVGTWQMRLGVLAATGNYLLFFGRDIWLTMRHQKRRMARDVDRISRQAGKAEPRHRCHVCGRDSDAHPELDFRYCSKCAGDYCYCSDHLRNHVHVVAEPTAAE